MSLDSGARKRASKAKKIALVNSNTINNSISPFINDALITRQRKDYLVPTRSQPLIGGLPNGTASVGAGGWNYANARLSVESVNTRRSGVPVLKVLAGANDSSTGSATVRVKIPTTSLTSKLELWVYLPEQSAGYVQLNVYYSSDVPADPPSTRPSNRRSINLGSDMLQYGSWFPITLGVGTNAYYSQVSPSGSPWSNTGTPDGSTINYLEIEYPIDTSTPATERYFLVDQVAANGKGRPMVMLGFDGIPDNNSSYDGGAMVGKTRALFDQFGLRGYIAQDGNNINSTNQSIHDALYARGWDIVQQGMQHTNYQTYPGNLATDIQTARAILQSYGYTRALDFIMYPFNARSLTVDSAAAQNGMRAQREFRKPGFVVSSLGRQNLFRLGSYDAGQKTAVQMQAWVDDAIAKGEIINIYTHIMRTTAGSSTETTYSEYATFLAYVAAKYYAGLIDIVTPSEFLATLINYPMIP